MALTKQAFTPATGFKDVAAYPNPTTGAVNRSQRMLPHEQMQTYINDTLTVEIEAAFALKADDSAAVHKTGNETVAGIKTFSSSPIVPTATASGQAINKGQLDTTTIAQAPDRGISGVKLALKAVSILEVADNTLTEAQMANDMKKQAGGVAPYDTTPKKTTSSITYYVNVSTGNDSNDGLTTGTALKTITYAISIIPQIVDHAVVINVAVGDYSGEGALAISGYTGKGSITINGDTVVSLNYSIDSLNVVQNGCFFALRGFNITTTSSGAGIALIRCYGRNIISYCNLIAISSGSGIAVESTNNGAIKNCVISNKSNAILCQNSSTITSENNSGAGNGVGLRSDLGGKIAKTGSQPGGATAEAYSGGGQIL